MHDEIEEMSFKMIYKSLKLSERKKVFNVPKNTNTVVLRYCRSKSRNTCDHNDKGWQSLHVFSFSIVK